jgi:predicted nucleic acid-binding protein
VPEPDGGAWQALDAAWERIDLQATRAPCTEVIVAALGERTFTMAVSGARRASHRAILGGFLKAPWMTSRLVPDADLAALAIEHGLTLCSTDGDFARFPGLKWENPLAA